MAAHKKLRVLIPLDGTNPGQSALEAMPPLARTGPVECTLLHVAESAETAHGPEAWLSPHREALESLGIPTRVRIVTGNPSEEILRQASGGEIDLVAMSTHGRQGMDRVLMGSVAEEVFRSSSVPTLLCRRGFRVPAWEHIVVALSGLTEAEEVLDDVLVLARRLGSTVHLVQVGLNLLRSNAYRGVAFNVPAEESPRYLDDIAARFTGEGIPVTTDHRCGMAAIEIARFAKELKAGLICLTTHGYPEEMPGLDRSVAAEVIRQAPCPVYVRRMTPSPCRAR